LEIEKRGRREKEKKINKYAKIRLRRGKERREIEKKKKRGEERER
jgi:hypothetical protein